MLAAPGFCSQNTMVEVNAHSHKQHGVISLVHLSDDRNLGAFSRCHSPENKKWTTLFNNLIKKEEQV